MTKLYYISSEDEEGNDVSCVVEAECANDAVNQWHEWLKEFQGAYDPDLPTPDRQVYELPEKTGVSHYFQWHQPGGVIEHEI